MELTAVLMPAPEGGYVALNFERLRKDFERSPAKNTTVQNLKQWQDSV